ncbi:LysR substrate-binding domain-containing protein [Actinoalloteichus hymeniacidonis]|uniref:Transcriptional regulator n=1 Tax=Actinoalloteichus hymeniacidonis TaxID=340345 RepID=A0AAC9HR43_9PSEU|nr:LysR substrate-binding domain-containing protein [Actinoalloteichus hymeniacidonis]AOS63895.1 transcriptional regulator [Actinoalloteichus hymeniacidonis]MBB5908049.1 DNA-binding transcriptional LysR family regulator [Actinoalloteichus hymeniacidonis]
MLDLHRLRLLRELSRRGTLAAVAKALSYTPSAISQQLTRLEEEVGVPLREQVGRKVRLTAQGEILVAHTEAVLERLERAESELAASMTELTGTLRIAAFQTTMLSLVPEALSGLRRAHPRLRVEVTQAEPEEALPLLLTRDFDLVIGEEYPHDPEPRPVEVEQEDLVEDVIRLACPRTFTDAEVVGTESAVPGLGAEPRPLPADPGEADPAAMLRSAATLPWIMEPPRNAARRWALALCRDAGFEPDVRIVTADALTCLRFVEQGHGVALISDLVWAAREPTVPLYPLPQPWGRRRLFTAARRGSGAHPAVRACRDALCAAAKATPIRSMPA